MQAVVRMMMERQVVKSLLHEESAADVVAAAVAWRVRRKA